jgi:hypothetical protein
LHEAVLKCTQVGNEGRTQRRHLFGSHGHPPSEQLDGG